MDFVDPLSPFFHYDDFIKVHNFVLLGMTFPLTLDVLSGIEVFGTKWNENFTFGTVTERKRNELHFKICGTERNEFHNLANGTERNEFQKKCNGVHH